MLTGSVSLFAWPVFSKVSNKDIDKEVNTAFLTTDEAVKESFFDGIPPAALECTFGGSLTEVFPGRFKFRSSENAVLIDKENRKMAVREKILTNDKKSTGQVDVYIEVSNVSNEDLVNLLVLKKTVRTEKAEIDLVLKKTTDDGQTIVRTTIKKQGEDLTPAILFAKIDGISTAKFGGQDYYLVDGKMKLRISEVLKGADDEALDESFLDDRTGIMKCAFKKCPVIKTDLEKFLDKLKEQFGLNAGIGNVVQRD